MAELRYLKGDATCPQAPGNKIIAHICNDIGGWGRGFVMALSKRWDEPEQQYRAWHRGDVDDPPFELGQVQFVQAKSGSLDPVTVAGQVVDPQGTVFIAATLGTATMTLDCLPQRIPSGDGDSVVMENNTCIGNLAGYQASGGHLGHNRELS